MCVFYVKKSERANEFPAAALCTLVCYEHKAKEV